MGETIVSGKGAVAEHFGVSVRQVRNWERAGMPGRSGRSYDLVKIQLWRDQKQGRGGGGDPRQGFLSAGCGKDFHEERLKRAQADLKELEVRRERGELINVSEVEQLFAGRAAVYKQSVLGLEPFILALLPDEERRTKAAEVRRRLREAVENIIRPLPEKFRTAEGGSS